MKRRTKNTLKRLLKKNFGLVFGLVAMAVLYVAQNTPKDEPETKAKYSDSIIGPTISANSNDITVIDGDTIKIDNKSVRFGGIDAPERNQTCLDSEGNSWDCGKASTNYLKKLINEEGRVFCVQSDIDRYKRIIGICFAGKKSINELMVRNGMALAYRTYSKHYIEYEEAAKRANRGLWQGTFVEPWEYRRQN